MPESSVDVVHWWRHKNLRSLNLLMMFPLLSLFTQGYASNLSHSQDLAYGLPFRS